MHDTLSLEPLQKVNLKEGEIQCHISPGIDRHFNDTDEETQDDKYP